MTSKHAMQYTPVFRKMTISCDTFGGFSLNLDIGLFNDKSAVINHVLDKLLHTLVNSGMEQLIEKLAQTRKLYHIHDYDIGEMLITDQEYYICNHNCG
jgi:hypothetical protein